jgi:hypothetical protein
MRSSNIWNGVATSAVLASALLASGAGCKQESGANEESRRAQPPTSGGAPKPVPTRSAAQDRAGDDSKVVFEAGRQTFRFDTFGDEAFWGDTLGLHRVIAGAPNGGTGPGLSPKAALAVGLKVDAEALPPELVAAIKAGKVNLDDPATTLALLKLNAVVGITGFFDGDKLKSVGIQCAFCHSTVDDSFAPGIGHRRDGWSNQDLDVGAIVSMSQDLSVMSKLLGVDDVTVRKVLKSWGPGRYDAQLLLDGKAFRPDGKTAATLIPPAFGLAGVNQATSTGWGNVTYWNAFVANIEMHGMGTFFDPRLDDAKRFPIAAKQRFGHITSVNDRITPKLAGLQFYQLGLAAPSAPEGTYVPAAAKLGAVVFGANCTSCHVDRLMTEPGWAMHTGAEMGIDEFQALRSPDGKYRTTPLRGLWTHVKRGFYHDGRFATLLDVVNHYDAHFKLALSETDKANLVEFLKSL